MCNGIEKRKGNSLINLILLHLTANLVAFTEFLKNLLSLSLTICVGRYHYYHYAWMFIMVLSSIKVVKVSSCKWSRKIHKWSWTSFILLCRLCCSHCDQCKGIWTITVSQYNGIIAALTFMSASPWASAHWQISIVKVIVKKVNQWLGKWWWLASFK